MQRALAVAFALPTLLLLAAVGTADAAAPAPCNGVPQVTDPVGDGHHTGTDITAAWLSEAGGSLQAVIRVRYGTWRPEHEDEPVTGSDYVLVFDVGSDRRYVRVSAPLTGPLVYDYGTYTAPATFTSLGATTGSVTTGVEQAAVIDVPAAALGITTGARIGRPVALTIDGRSALGVPHWVDHAPGGTDPLDTATGADYVVGSCSGGGTGTGTTTSVAVTAPRTLVGGGMARISGSVAPARGGVLVQLVVAPTSTTARTRTYRLLTGADGTFDARVQVLESSTVRAEAEQVGSQSASIAVRSRVTVTTRHLRSGDTLVQVRTWPALPGQLLLLEASSVEPSIQRTVRRTARTATTTIRVRRAARGRYQVVYVPGGERAERSVSRSFVLWAG